MIDENSEEGHNKPKKGKDYLTSNKLFLFNARNDVE